MNDTPTVYLVDDDSGARNSMRFLLESDGFSVEPFGSAREFLEAYDPARPGCLVLDVRMPEMDGLELQKRLQFQGQHLPVIFVTGHGDVPICARAMKAGAVDFLEKPVDDEMLLGLVRKSLTEGLRRHQRTVEEHKLLARIEKLSPRERDVMQLMNGGKPIKQIATDLGISVQTAAKHRTRVLEKLGIENETELVRLLMHRRPPSPRS
jgi:FixJ family two-component response regulator